jgi:LemA protein
MAAENVLSGAMGRLFAVMEAYPNLKADQNVSRLMEELTGTENKISFARQFYNDSVMTLNNMVQSFPSNLIAGLFSFKTGTYFEVPETEKATPKVDLR